MSILENDMKKLTEAYDNIRNQQAADPIRINLVNQLIEFRDTPHFRKPIKQFIDGIRQDIQGNFSLASAINFYRSSLPKLKSDLQQTGGHMAVGKNQISLDEQIAVIESVLDMYDNLKV